MKHSAYIDRTNRNSFLVKELKLKAFSLVRSNSFLPLAARAYGSFVLQFTKPYISRTHNYCVLTSRSRSVIRDFRVSRMTFKRLASFGLLNGVKKGSW